MRKSLLDCYDELGAMSRSLVSSEEEYDHFEESIIEIEEALNLYRHRWDTLSSKDKTYCKKINAVIQNTNKDAAIWHKVKVVINNEEKGVYAQDQLKIAVEKGTWTRDLIIEIQRINLCKIKEVSSILFKTQMPDSPTLSDIVEGVKVESLIQWFKSIVESNGLSNKSQAAYLLAYIDKEFVSVRVKRTKGSNAIKRRSLIITAAGVDNSPLFELSPSYMSRHYDSVDWPLATRSKVEGIINNPMYSIKM